MENLYVNKVPILGEEIFIRMSRQLETDSARRKSERSKDIYDYDLIYRYRRYFSKMEKQDIT